MCKYCDFYVKQIDDPDYVPMLFTASKLVNGLVNMDIDLCIAGKYDSKIDDFKPSLLLTESYIADNDRQVISEKSCSKNIKYCPFCGIDLREAREEHEKAAD